MDKLNEFINMLNDDKMTAKFYEYYKECTFDIDKKWKNPHKFVSYIKAFYVDRYIEAPEDLKELLFNQVKDGQLNYGANYVFLNTLRGMAAKVNQFIEYDEYGELVAPEEYSDDPLYDTLTEHYTEHIAEIVKTYGSYITIEELVDGNYEVVDGYVVSQDEIKTILYAKLIPGYISAVHALYDEFDDENDERTICNYDAIEDETLRKLAFHTDKDNPDYDIIFPDGIIMNYYKGDIRFCPITFDEIVEYTKLKFIDNYYYGDENDVFQEQLKEHPDIDANVSFDEMDGETFGKLVMLAAELVVSAANAFENIYSKRMIDQYNNDVDRMSKLVLKYKL